MATYGHVGIMFPVAIVIGFLIGDRIDRWLGTSPWIALVGFGLGVVSAMRNLLRAVDRQERLEAEAKRSREDD